MAGNNKTTVLVILVPVGVSHPEESDSSGNTEYTMRCLKLAMWKEVTSVKEKGGGNRRRPVQ